MLSVYEALHKLAEAGLPTSAAERLPANDGAAEKVLLHFLKRYGGGVVSADNMSESIVGAATAKTFFKKEEIPQIVEEIGRRGSPAIVWSYDPASLKSHFGIIAVDERGQITVDVLPRANGVEAQLKSYHELSKGTKTPSHSLVLEPGRLWRVVENARSARVIKTDAETGKRVAAELRENGYLERLSNLTGALGTFNVSFYRTSTGRYGFFHPVTATPHFVR